jgi:ABC-type cobalamin/Fe3+-siderophores transport system ATPase subunit
MGQRASALVLFILSQDENDVVIIDQPEDDIDNQVVYTEFIKKLKEKKVSTQFIFATHNANIPVLGDAERVIAANNIEGVMHIATGTIDSKESQQQIVDIMEGGYEAFKRRNTIYSSWEKNV